MDVLYVWNNEDRSIKIYATIKQVEEYEKENQVKLYNGGKIISVVNTQTNELFIIEQNHCKI